MTSGPPDEPLTAAEQRLVAILRILRAPAPTAGAELAERVMWRLRVDVVLRGMATAVGTLGAAFADGLALLLGPRSRRSPP